MEVDDILPTGDEQMVTTDDTQSTETPTTTDSSPSTKEGHSPETPSKESSDQEEPMQIEPTKLVDRILKTHTKLQMVDKDLTKQCQRIGNLLQSYTKPESPQPPRVNKSYSLISIDLEHCGTDTISNMQRKLWLQNLLQLKESFGDEVIFYNGKVIWQCQLAINCKEKEEGKSLTKCDNVNKAIPEIPETPESPDEKNALGKRNVEPTDTPGVRETPESPVGEIAHTKPIVPELTPKTPDPLEIPDKENNVSSDIDMDMDATNKITPQFKHTEMDISKIKSYHRDSKDTNLVSNKEEGQSRLNKVKRKLNANDPIDSTECTDTNVSNQSDLNLNSKDLNKSKSLTPIKRKRAAEFFDSDMEASDPSDNSDDNSDDPDHNMVAHGVSKGIKKLRMSAERKPLDTLGVSKEDVDQGINQILTNIESGLNLEQNASQSQICLRKCLVCGIESKNMKRHTIFEHLTDIWWGVQGESTCWLCQQYHTYQDIRYCEGYYVPQRDYKNLVCRHAEFFSFVKDNLECETDQDLLDIIVREGLCNKSISNFSTNELEFMRHIDRAKGLPTNHMYRAQFPTRTTELLHWRTLSSLMNFSNMRGCITSNTITQRPLRFIDTNCNVLELYKLYNYKGVLAMFPILLNTGTSNYLYKVITEVTDPQILFSPWSNLLFLDRDIKISLGLHPRMALRCTTMYIKEVENLVYDGSVVAIGGVGLDNSFPVPLENQVSVFVSFLKIAAKYQKTLRLICIGTHQLCMHLMEQHLPSWHIIHYLNFNGSIDEARDFLGTFTNGFLGVSLTSVGNSSSADAMIRNLPIERIVPASNSPCTLPNRAQVTLPTDVGEVIHKVSLIKNLSLQDVARQFRTNTSYLYGI